MKPEWERTGERSKFASFLLDKEEAAAYIHMSVSWCEKNLKKFIPFRNIGRPVLYHKDDLDRLLESFKHPPIGFNAVLIKSTVSLKERLRGNRLHTQK